MDPWHLQGLLNLYFQLFQYLLSALLNQSVQLDQQDLLHQLDLVDLEFLSLQLDPWNQ